MTTITSINTAKLILTFSKEYKYQIDDHMIYHNMMENLSKIKLLNLLYYIQGYHLALFDKPLFNKKIQTSKYGVVIPDVYEWLKSISNYDLSRIKLNNIEINNLELHPQQIKLIKNVLDIYYKYSAYGLIDKISKELPYIISYEKYKNNEITQDSLKNFFIPLVEK